MKRSFAGFILTAIFAVAGCDVDVNSNTPAAEPNVQTPAENRMDRREERRENIKDSVDGVDVEVGNGGVKVDVDGE